MLNSDIAVKACVNGGSTKMDPEPIFTPSQCQTGVGKLALVCRLMVFLNVYTWIRKRNKKRKFKLFCQQ